MGVAVHLFFNACPRAQPQPARMFEDPVLASVNSGGTLKSEF